jgi:hypothetical protein
MGMPQPAKTAKKKDEIIGRGKTADGKSVQLWSDGTLTWGLGNAIKGSPHARTPAQVEVARRAGWLVLGDVSIYDADEVSRLIAAARKIAARGGSPGDLRAEFARSETREERLTPVWVTQEADREGRPTVRVWKLPRLLYGGLAVWDDRRGTGTRGRYQVMREIGRTGTYTGPLVQFDDFDALSAYLRDERGRFLDLR